MNFVGISKLSLLDYPGKMSAILFTRGCNFRCPFCHNGLTLLENSSEEIPFEEILEFLRKRKGVLDGVVISGGEPTLMPDIKEKIIAIRELGYSIKLDSNGTNPDILEDLIKLKLVDFVAMDIKNSLEKYSFTTDSEVKLMNIRKSINILQDSGIDYEFRTTLVKEFHGEEDILKIGELLKGSKALYLQQFKVSDGVLNKNLHPVDEDLANKFKNILEKYINKVELRGY